MASLFAGDLQLPSISSVLSFYASLSALTMIIRTILNEVLPRPARQFIAAKFSDLVSNHFSTGFTFVIEDRWQAVTNETFRAIQAYLPTKAGPATNRLLLGHNDSNNTEAPPQSGIPVDGKVRDEFQGMKLEWTLHEKENKRFYPRHSQWFELRCSKKDKDRVMQTYLPHICKEAQKIFNHRETLNIYTYDHDDSRWESTVFKHPATFDTLAMEPELKQWIIDDLDMFVQRKEYFQSVGRAWKRGYLLYGPPGTGKSTLVAAIANYLRFHIYDLQLQSVRTDSELRRVLTATTNRSILLIEDVDCSTKSTKPRATRDEQGNPDEREDDETDDKLSFIDPGVTLSGLLNFIDGLWSTCGDERIIIFTTNHKDKLDPAMLRPGRMDVHLYMGHCTPAAFKLLAARYLGIEDHSLYNCVEDMMQKISATPAEVAQQLMKSDKPEVALGSLIEFLKAKESEIEDSKLFTKEEEVIKQEVTKSTKEEVAEQDEKKKLL